MVVAVGPKTGYMRYHRFWIEIVVLGSAVALALALLMATVGAAAGAAEGEHDSAQLNPSNARDTQITLVGMVTCSRCGAKHSPTLERSASTCVRVCVHGGAAFALVNPETTYILDGDPVALKKLAGQRARVVGTVDGQTVKVVSAVSET
jgi:hypothetical protein